MTHDNVLLVTFDQLTAAVLDGPLAAAVELPNLAALRARGTTFLNHFTVTTPCGPARASLLTGLYAMNHRAIRNGTPLAGHHATIATEARKSGYEPLLFGYTDIAADPTTRDPEDPDLSFYEGVAPGFRELVETRQDHGVEWPAYLRRMGYDIDPPRGASVAELYRPVATGPAPDIRDPALYAAEHSDSAYLTDRTIEALDIRRGTGRWFAHLSYIRPHPPLVAPAPYNHLVDPGALPAPDLDRPDHPFCAAWFSGPSNRGLFWGFDGDCATLDPAKIQDLRAVYLGLVAEADAQFGRVLDWLDHSGQADTTLVVVTADHGEMLGNKRMWGKESVFDPAYRIPLTLAGPGIAPGHVVTALTESVDVTPTVLDWIGRIAPLAMDGQSLLPFASGQTPETWRDATFHEVEFGHPVAPTRIQTHLGLGFHQSNAVILREADWKHIHFGGGLPPMLFDLANDPGERADLGQDPAHAGVVSRLARKLIDRMTERRDRRLTHHAIGH